MSAFSDYHLCAPEERTHDLLMACLAEMREVDARWRADSELARAIRDAHDAAAEAEEDTP